MITVLRAIRDRLKDDAAITAWFAAHFPDKTPRYFLGYKEDRSAKEFPYIAVAPADELIEKWPGHSKPVISIICGVIDPDVVEDESQALVLLDELTALALNAVQAQPLCEEPRLTWTGQARRSLDFGMKHPTYEAVVTLLELEIY